MLGIYCRTSKQREEKYTLESQKDEGIKCAKALGLDYTIYIDDGISGTKDENIRDGLSMLFSDMKKSKLTAVYCYDQGRIERENGIWDVFQMLCLNFDIKFYPGGNFYDLEDPALRMAANMTSLFNNYYTQQTSLKVRDANARKAANGKTHGLKPYGYSRNDDNYYEINENEAKYVRLMFSMSLEGIGAYRIANYLNDLEVPTKFSGNFKDNKDIKRKNKYTGEVNKFKKSAVKWRGNVISDILKNPIYKGERIWRVHKDKFDIQNGKKIKQKIVTQTIKSQIPAIITEELWNKVQANFKVNKKESVGKKAHYHYLLNGLVYCERCGNKYWGKKRLKGNDNAYKCLSKKYPNPKCDNRGLSLPRLETFILNYLQRKPISSRVLKDLPKPASLLDQYLEQKQGKAEELKKISSSIKNLANKLDKTSAIDEVLDKLDSMQKKRQSLIDDIAILEKNIAAEEQLNPNLNSIKEGRRRISMISKINAEFDEITKVVKQLVDWVSIQYVNEHKPAFFKIKIKLKDQQYIDEYIADFHLKEFNQAGIYVSKLNSKSSPVVNLSRTIEFNLKQILENIKILSPAEAKRPSYNNFFQINDADIYKFD
jgi:site-specific DNA recombinase